MRRGSGLRLSWRGVLRGAVGVLSTGDGRGNPKLADFRLHDAESLDGGGERVSFVFLSCLGDAVQDVAERYDGLSGRGGQLEVLQLGGEDGVHDRGFSPQVNVRLLPLHHRVGLWVRRLKESKAESRR